MPLQNSLANPPASAGGTAPEDYLPFASLETELPLLRGVHTPEEIARARANIAEWSEYLPTECVRLMIAQGWHLSVQR
jgi:hypothetical protein